jgi:lipopolysaccharide export system protein LptA
MDSFALTSRREPIRIRSRDLEFRYNEKRVTYRGDVMVTQGETTLKSDTLTVTYEDQPKGQGSAQTKTETSSFQQQLQEIVAEGNVQITSGDRRATSKKAVFNETTRTVVLSGSVVLEEEGNQVTGEKVTVYVDEKRSVVEGTGGKEGQVVMVISPRPEEGKKGVKTP